MRVPTCPHGQGGHSGRSPWPKRVGLGLRLVPAAWGMENGENSIAHIAPSTVLIVQPQVETTLSRVNANVQTLSPMLRSTLGYRTWGGHQSTPTTPTS